MRRAALPSLSEAREAHCNMLHDAALRGGARGSTMSLRLEFAGNETSGK
jgi:hypothetical protein